MAKISIEQFKYAQKAGANVIDVRDTADFKVGYIPGSIHIPFDVKFEERLHDIIPAVEPLLIITEGGKEAEIEELLKKNRYQVEGWLDGGFKSWQQNNEQVDMIIDVEADELMMDIPFDDHLIVVDVRQPIEFAEGHLKDALNIPLHEITGLLKISQFEDTDNLYLHCGGGTRSIIASSILKKHGIHNLRNISGGWSKIKEEPRAEIVKEPEVLN